MYEIITPAGARLAISSDFASAWRYCIAYNRGRVRGRAAVRLMTA